MMVPIALYPITKYFEELGTLSPLKIPQQIAQRKFLFSKGNVNLYQGEGIEKLINLSVKGLHLYHYDFGIVYPEKEYVYPIFYYQVIFAPQRILVLTHYAFGDTKRAEEMAGMQELLHKDASYEEIFLTAFKPQAFVSEDIVPNQFNGLVRVKDIDNAYNAIAQLFNQWHRGMLEQGKTTSAEEIQRHQQWFKGFRTKFYQQDYGFISTKRYMGKKWAKEVFEEYLFNL